MLRQNEPFRTVARTPTFDTVRAILSWIAETDRRFRATQKRIDRFRDRF